MILHIYIDDLISFKNDSIVITNFKFYLNCALT